MIEVLVLVSIVGAFGLGAFVVAALVVEVSGLFRDKPLDGRTVERELYPHTSRRRFP